MAIIAIIMLVTFMAVMVVTAWAIRGNSVTLQLKTRWPFQNKTY